MLIGNSPFFFNNLSLKLRNRDKIFIKGKKIILPVFSALPEDVRYFVIKFFNVLIFFYKAISKIMRYNYTNF